MTGFTPELVERINEEADWLSGAELDGLRLSVGGAVNVMREAASGIAELIEALAEIAEHKTDHPCASAWEEDRRTLVEVQAMAERALAKIGGNHD